MKRFSCWVGVIALALGGCSDDSSTGGAGGAGGSVGDGGTATVGAGGVGGATPECCGCLCGDPTWSCSKETCLDENGAALALVPEAGFFELPGADFVSYDGARQSPRARVWYSFQPAETSPETKPLVILFNGISGPTLGLLAYNIGHFTFDPATTAGADFADNPHRWTDFANLLYIDEPGAGYSYHMARADGSTPLARFDAYGEAGDYLRILFRFLRRHPQIADAPVIIAGESGAGIRGTYMTKILLDYQTLVNGAGTYQDEELYNEIVEFYASRRSDIDPTGWKPTDVVGEFTHQVFINPMVTPYQWDYLTTLQGPEIQGCVADPSPLDCSETVEEAELRFQHVLRVATDPAILSQVLRCDMTSIEWLYAANRTGEYARTEFANGVPPDQTELIEVFGQLEPQHEYYLMNPNAIHNSWDLGPEPVLEQNNEHGRVALRTFVDVPTFITNGLYDLRFNAQFIPPSLANYTDMLVSATANPTEPATVERPGQIELIYVNGLPFGGGTVIIPNPSYPAGHAVSARAPAELREDVMAFIGQ